MRLPFPELPRLAVGALLLSACAGGSELVLPGGGNESAALAIRTQPPTAVASGQRFDRQPVVQIRDEQGNDVAVAGVTVTASLASGGGQLTGTTQRITDSRGSATFTDLAITGAPGLHRLAFTAPDYGSVSSIDIQVTAGPDGAPTAAFTASCTGRTCAFNSEGSSDRGGQIERRVWDFGDGAHSEETNPSHTYQQGGTYNVVLRVTDDDELSDESSAPVTVTGPVQAGTTTTITSDDPDPSGFGRAITVRFTVTSPSGDPTGDVVISDSKGGSCTGQAPSGSCTFVPAGSGSRTITATYQGNSSFSGSSDSEGHTVRQPNPNNQRPVADFEIVCDDSAKTCIFTDTSKDSDGSLVSWRWEFGDGTGSNERNPPPHTYPAQSEYLVNLTVTDNDGATDTRTRMVKMDD